MGNTNGSQKMTRPTLCETLIAVLTDNDDDRMEQRPDERDARWRAQRDRQDAEGALLDALERLRYATEDVRALTARLLAEGVTSAKAGA